jgi:hypothetical protein
LDNPAICVSISDIVAIINLALWAYFIGQQSLAMQLMKIACGTWEKCDFAVDQDQIPRNASNRDLLHYWERWRVQEVLVRLPWTASAAVRNVISPPVFDIAKLAFPATPPPRIWNLIQNSDVDSASLGRSPLFLDGVRFLQYSSDDPRRITHLAKFTSMVTCYVRLIYFTHQLLRNRVDSFIAACLKAGISNPAMLPLREDGDASITPQIRALLAQREELDATLLQTRAAYPEPVDGALKAGDAIALLRILEEELGSKELAFNMCMLFPSIPMLCLELYTGLGGYMTPGTDLVADAEYLADPFSGGQLHSDLLAEAVSNTRLLEGWVG